MAAVSSSGSLIFLLVGLFNGIAMGAGVVIARYFGARDQAHMRRAIHATVFFGIVAGLALTVLGIVLTPQLLRWMGTPETVLPSPLSISGCILPAHWRWCSITWQWAFCRRWAIPGIRCIT